MLLWFPSWHFFVTRQQNPCPRKERTARHLSLRHLVSMAHDSFQKAYCSLGRIGVPTNTLGCYFQITLSLSMGASVDKMIPWNVSPSLWFCSKSTVASGTHTLLSTAWYIERLPRGKKPSQWHPHSHAKVREKKPTWLGTYHVLGSVPAPHMLYLIEFSLRLYDDIIPILQLKKQRWREVTKYQRQSGSEL